MQRGFTLFEMLLSVSIIALLVMGMLPTTQILLASNDMDNSVVTTVHALREAGFFSETMKEDSQWGVNMATSTITVFKGATYATRDTTWDETYTFPPSITLSGIAQEVYTKNSNTPATTGTITLTSTFYDTRTITINADGILDY